MSTSRTYHHGALRDALLETTRTLLADVGADGLSLREVSRRAGVSHAAAYNHFRDKAALVRAVVEAAFARLVVEMAEARDRAREPRAALRAIGLAYVRFAYRFPAEFRIMFRPELFAHDDEKADGGGRAHAILVEAVEACQRAGAIDPGPVGPPVLAAWAVVHGLASLIIDGPDPGIAPTLADAEALARSCLATMASGLETRAPKPKRGKRTSPK